MFTRHVIMELKPNAATEFANVIDSKVLPFLSKQKGFRDMITFAPRSFGSYCYQLLGHERGGRRLQCLRISRVLKTLTNLVAGTPRVGVAELATSTLHKLAAAKTA